MNTVPWHNAEKVAADVENKTLFFDLWWQKVDNKNAKRLVSKSEQLEYYLTLLRRECKIFPKRTRRENN